MDHRRRLLILGQSFLLAFAAVGATAIPGVAATTITVNDTGDQPDANGGAGDCDTGAGQCTLRAAIQTANDRDGEDVIEFSFGGTGVVRIDVGDDDLPTITSPVVIDGYSVSGAKVNTASTGTNAVLRIAINGPGAAGDSIGLNVNAPSQVSGLIVQDFYWGIFIDGGGAGSTIWGNFVGVSASGNSKAPNHNRGIFVEGPNVTVGGTSKAARNLVSGNAIGISTCFDSDGGRVQGNLVGVRRNGSTPLGNEAIGIQVFGSNNIVIGGDATGAPNLVKGNGVGIALVLNTGVAPSRIRILRNSIFDNVGKGITMVSGANSNQKAPVITSAVTRNGRTTITGYLKSTKSTTFSLRFYVNPAGGDEGKTFLVKKSVRTNSSGRANFSFRAPVTVSLGKTITANATNDAAKRSSVFSGRRTVTSRAPSGSAAAAFAAAPTQLASAQLLGIADSTTMVCEALR